MKQYQIESKNTNGSWSKHYIKEFNNKEEADTFTTNMTAKTGFTFRAKFIKDIQVTKEVEETVDDTEEVLEVLENETDDEDEVEVEEKLSEAPEQIDYDFADSHDRSEFPRGWWLKSDFIAKDGTYFKFKKEQPKLYRTAEPTDY